MGVATVPKPIDSNPPANMPTEPLNSIQKSLLESQIVEGIREVYDPEIPVNVYDLGLIYDIIVKEDATVDIRMTLTSPACPVAESLPGEVETAVRRVPGVKDVALELTWDPPFTIDMISEDIKLMLGLL